MREQLQIYSQNKAWLWFEVRKKNICTAAESNIYKQTTPAYRPETCLKDICLKQDTLLEE